MALSAATTATRPATRPPADRPTVALFTQVAAIETIAEGVVAVELVAGNGGQLPEWAPGAHIELHLPAFIRSFSLCGDPADRTRYRIGVLREPNGRGGSAYVHDTLRVNDIVPIGAPHNRFPLVAAPRYRFLAGGIGITPFLPMIAELARRGADWDLHYGARSRRTMAFLDELAHYGAHVQLHPQDEVGLLELNALLDLAEPTAVYCCGPAPMIDAVEQACRPRAAIDLHRERFGVRHTVDAAPPTPFEVYCAESELTVQVTPRESLLDALITAGLDVNYDCREGTCGTCELDLLSGEAEHLDAVDSPGQHDRDGVIFPCVSRARCPRLVLDI